jgi:hypothetical protein
MRGRVRRPVLTVALALMMSGCGGARVVKVAGKVTFRGEPVGGVTVRFVPEGARPSSGRTNDQGEFTLRYDRDKEGACVGRHAVAITYSPKTMDEQMGKKPGQLSPELQEVLRKYGDSRTSGLEYEINQDGQFFDIQLQQAQ